VKKLLIIHSTVGLSKIYTLIKYHKIKEWVPFITNFEEVAKIEEKLRVISNKKEINIELQETAARIRRPFFKITAMMGQQYNSLSWWANSISERNTMANKLFLYCCYVSIANNHILQNKNLCIVCDNIAVINNITMIAKQHGYYVIKKKAFITIKDTLLWTICAGLYRLLEGIYLWLLTKANKIYYQMKKVSVSQIKPDIMIHTWVDEKCFGTDGKFKDRYFTILPEFYKGKGLKVSTFVTLYNIRCSYWCAISFFRVNRDNFIIPEDYYKLYDYLFPFWIWIKRIGFRFNLILIEGVDCSRLFNLNNKNERINFTTMYYLLFKRLAHRRIIPKVLIDGFENMISDKMIQLGIRKFMPETLVYGFYHTTPSPNILCFFTEQKETEFAPLPDRIICNGSKFKNILIHEHFPKERIVTGTALRYFYLYTIKKPHRINTQRNFVMLLILPLENEAALEIFYKLTKAIHGIDNYHLLIKPHPMNTSIIDRIKNNFFPNTEVVKESIEEAISRCDIVISAATGAAIDCLMADKEVIRVGRDTQIDFDPIAWFGEFGQPVYSIQQLRERIIGFEKNIKNESYIPPKFSSMLPELFLPATEENMTAFLPPHS